MCIEVKGLEFGYGNIEVLKNINFKIERGKFICLLGKNGAGKTTLFKCILDLIHGYKGSIFIDGKDIREYSVRERASKISYIPQVYDSVFDFSVLDMVVMGMTSSIGMFKMPGLKEKENAKKALSIIGLQHLAYCSFSQISGGERQMVLIARSIAQGAKILFMDEPCASLDYGNQIKVMQVLKSLSNKGYMVFQITHNPDHAFIFADDVLVLKDGSIKAHGRPCEVMTQKLLEDLYNIPVSIISVGNKGNKICVPIMNENIINKV